MPPKKAVENPIVYISDQYQQRWRIEEDEPLYQEALAAVKAAGAEPVVWPIQKLTENRSWGWWTVFKKLDEFEANLVKLVPHPGQNRLLAIDREYTPTELQDLLQQYGSYLSTLHHIEGMLEAQCHALKEGIKTGIAVAMAQADNLVSNTVAGKEGEIIANSDTFRNSRKLQIANESQLLLLKGWRESYEWAWNTVSRIISLRSSEIQLQTGRHP